jgi:hypothetical protein
MKFLKNFLSTVGEYLMQFDGQFHETFIKFHELFGLTKFFNEISINRMFMKFHATLTSV